jgi:hypothetical protein
LFLKERTTEVKIVIAKVKPWWVKRREKERNQDVQSSRISTEGRKRTLFVGVRGVEMSKRGGSSALNWLRTSGRPSRKKRGAMVGQ